MDPQQGAGLAMDLVPAPVVTKIIPTQRRSQKPTYLPSDAKGEAKYKTKLPTYLRQKRSQNED